MIILALALMAYAVGFGVHMHRKGQKTINEIINKHNHERGW